ncbi:hypothetical protein, variant [Blastomyces dermatitidis ER-3]|nr:uncharacterized protein BDCG_05684 [Blastomyces dermatitidis ER-3]XP_045281361.1 hypothetical protein, variant [Blastomyces dermatitidis ER-3]OAT01633.1 hypothetical protein BDCG_05684 [Blastomyces dermatitidis ER-3]OAT01634.1 hypothetical protein, variant [Blastomyces dermatitidis ER-3]
MQFMQIITELAGRKRKRKKTWATKAGWLDETHLPFPDCCALLFVLFPALAPAFSLSHYPRSVHAADEPLHRGCRAGEESLSQPDSPLVTPARVELCSIVDDWRACWG